MFRANTDTIKSALYIPLKPKAAQANNTKYTLSDQNNVETLYGGLKSMEPAQRDAGPAYCYVTFDRCVSGHPCVQLELH